MSKLPRYYVVKNTIFVHAGIDEYAASDGLWELGTCEHIFTCKYPTQTGRIENFNMKIVAGHIGTHCIAHNPHYHDIFYDGENHYYIDGSVGKSKRLPILMYDTDRDKYYRITESGQPPTKSPDSYINNFEPSITFKLIGGNLGMADKKFTLPHFLAMFN